MRRYIAILLAFLTLAAGPALAEQARGPQLREDVTSYKGRVTLYWRDDARGAPYTVTYRYVTEHPELQVEFIQPNIMEKSVTLDYMAPGGTYQVTLTDCRGNADQMTVTLPEPEPFADEKLTSAHISCGVAPRSRPALWETERDIKTVLRLYASDIIRDMGITEYGFRFYFSLPELRRPRVYHTQLVFRAPNGFICVFSMGNMLYATGSGAPFTHICWAFIGNELFEYLYDYTQSVPAGPYTLDCYWDGMAVCSTTFEIL